MPGIPLVARETTNSHCNCSCSRGTDQMCRQDSRVHFSAEEEAAVEESLSTYCKPVELYNILQRRAIENPSFLQRCLHYKIRAKHKKRIQMSVSLPATVNNGSQSRNPFPLCIMLARAVSSLPISESAYRFKRCCMLTSCVGEEGTNRTQARFILPEINKLSADIKSGSLSICFISFVEPVRENMDISSFPPNVGGHCLVGKIPMELLHLSWEKSPNLNLGERAETLLTVDMRPCFMKKSFLDEDKCVSFQTSHTSAQVSSQQLQVIITAEEVGARERSPYDSYSYNDIPSSSLAQISRLRTGNVVFYYKFHQNNYHRTEGNIDGTEVTEDFSCPFCLVKCASFKGLRYHLQSSHDFFSYEFWANEEYQAVNVSVRTDASRYEVLADGVDPKKQTFVISPRPLRRRKITSLIQSAKHVHPLVLDSELPEPMNQLPDRIDEHEASSLNAAGVSSATVHSNVDPETVQSFPGSCLTGSTMLQCSKTRKLSERSDPKNRTLLQKRQFYHSHRAQPMALEQVLSDRDSEDEVDDEVADLEDRRMLDDFVDVTKDEKYMMHLWNSFVRKQRVLADGHVPWACEAFSKLHAQALVQQPALLWCWRLFMIKLWNHGLLDGRTMNNCNLIFEQSQRNDSDPSTSKKNDTDPSTSNKNAE